MVSVKNNSVLNTEEKPALILHTTSFFFSAESPVVMDIMVVISLRSEINGFILPLHLITPTKSEGVSLIRFIRWVFITLYTLINYNLNPALRGGKIAEKML